MIYVNDILISDKVACLLNGCRKSGSTERLIQQSRYCDSANIGCIFPSLASCSWAQSCVPEPSANGEVATVASRAVKSSSVALPAPNCSLSCVASDGPPSGPGAVSLSKNMARETACRMRCEHEAPALMAHWASKSLVVGLASTAAPLA